MFQAISVLKKPLEMTSNGDLFSVTENLLFYAIDRVF